MISKVGFSAGIQAQPPQKFSNPIHNADEPPIFSMKKGCTPPEDGFLSLTLGNRKNIIC